jgi:hypothetical protein
MPNRAMLPIAMSLSRLTATSSLIEPSMRLSIRLCDISTQFISLLVNLTSTRYQSEVTLCAQDEVELE